MQDRISWLPDVILWRILSLLHKSDEVVRTGILSTKWKNLWAEVENLDIDDGLFQRMKYKPYQDKLQMERSLLNYIDKMIARYNFPYIERLCLSLPSSSSFDPTILDRLIAERDVRNLELRFHENQIALLPKRLFISTSLVVLKLQFDSLIVPTKTWLPNLKTLHLTTSKNFMSRFLEGFLSKCPCIEELRIKRQAENHHDFGQLELRIRIPTLKRYEMEFVDEDNLRNIGSWKKNDGIGSWRCNESHKITINAPRLEYLRVRDYQTCSFSLVDLSSLVEADVDWQPYDESGSPIHHSIMSLLRGIRSVKSLSLSGRTIQCLSMIIRFNPSIRPTFNRLTRLRLDLNVGSDDINREFFEMFLPCTPNLEYLTLTNKVCSGIDAYRNGRGQWTPPKHVPRCLSFHLKEITVEGLRKGYEDQVIKYLLLHSRVLKRLTIKCTNDNDDAELDLFEELSRVIRASVTSKIILQPCDP